MKAESIEMYKRSTQQVMCLPIAKPPFQHDLPSLLERYADSELFPFIKAEIVEFVRLLK